MHNIEPHFQWRDHYSSEKDERSPFYGRQYNEFQYSQKIYNYYIHPQWDAFGSPTLYAKILFTNYDKGYAIIELMGEWNDAITNDIMFLKRDVIDEMTRHDIHKFIIVCDNVLNYHGDSEDYYEEWWDDVKEEDGWIVLLNLLDHVEQEMQDTRLQNYVNFGGILNDVTWRPRKPSHLFKAVETLMKQGIKQLNW